MSNGEPSQLGFDEARYLLGYPDVRAAVERGQFESGWHHFESCGHAEGRSPTGTSAETTHRDAISSSNPLLRFEQRPPSLQTAVDIFRGRWASDLQPLVGVTGTGASRLFTEDQRPQQAAAALGVGGRFDRFKVLELGPLEAAHTYALERLGAESVVAVEANVEAFLKCLVVKEVVGLERSRFLLGDIVEYLAARPGWFDLVFASGVLYHMADPLRTIELISRATDRCFIWTHYYSAKRRVMPFHEVPHTHNGFSASYWSFEYGDRTLQFWGGNKATTSWLERDAIISAFRHYGLNDVKVISDDPDHPNGPCITFAARRSGT